MALNCYAQINWSLCGFHHNLEATWSYL